VSSTEFLNIFGAALPEDERLGPLARLGSPATRSAGSGCGSRAGAGRETPRVGSRKMTRSRRSARNRLIPPGTLYVSHRTEDGVDRRFIQRGRRDGVSDHGEPVRQQLHPRLGVLRR
jgi:hypothetical protein